LSELEDVVATVIRLLSKNMLVVKDDGNIAQIHVSSEWYDRELFKNYDGQITVGLAESQDQKVEMSGRIRRRLGTLRVNVWTTDKTASSDSGRVMRKKMVEEVNRIVRQNCNKPNETMYDFRGIGQPIGTHKAYSVASASELAPKHASWTELVNADYEKVWYSDDVRYSKGADVDGEYALALFRFKIDGGEKAVRKIVLMFEGYGVAQGNLYGVTIKVWNHVAEIWENSQTGTGTADETLAITLNSNLADYVDSDGYVWLLARTTDPSDGMSSAMLYCDYVNCTVTVNGIAHLDVISFRDADIVDVKPFIFRTEFSLKSWCFENIEGEF
jgi:hypothetical protein